MNASEPTGRQSRRVLNVLRVSAPGWACLRDFGSDAHVARNRISEMKAAGWVIDTRRCRRHNHEGQVAEYKLAPSSVAVESCGGSPANGVGATPLAPAPTALDLFPDHSRRLGHGL